MKTNHRIQSLLAFCACLAATTATPADYALTWWTAAGGGGTSSSGNYAVSGTLGQLGTGSSSGGPYSLEGGFWCIVAAVPTSNAPPLAVSCSGTGVLVSWPQPASGWVLEQTPTLNGNPPPWALVPASQYQTNANHCYLAVPSLLGSKFYRLRKSP